MFSGVLPPIEVSAMPDSANSILLVDDDDEQINLIEELLCSVGFDVVAVHSAEEGLKALQAREFAVVLSDHHMPGKTGGAMLAEAKAAGLLEQIGVLVLTSSLNEPELAGWRVLRKGIDPEVLRDEIHRAILSARR
jgi:CheY-like chemotaxis protein